MFAVRFLHIGMGILGISPGDALHCGAGVNPTQVRAMRGFPIILFATAAMMER
jgi:hypothetical protein